MAVSCSAGAAQPQIRLRVVHPPVRTVPAATVSRLPVYFRVLDRIAESRSTISSDLLAELAGTTAAIVRKDLSYLGSMGTRGAGYEVLGLRDRISAVLGANRAWPVAIVGMGNLGRALASYPGLAGPSFEVAALFDVDPAKVGRPVAGVIVRHLDELDEISRNVKLSIGVITTPAVAAEEVAGRLVEAGIHSILNFAPVRLGVSDGVLVRDVDLGLHLLVLSYNERSRLEG